MVSDKINEIMNEQINKEFFSGYLYLSMSAHLHELGLFGFSSWLKIQAREEVEHGLKLLDYLLERNSYVTLRQIRTPEFEFKGVKSVFETLYEHEKCITHSVMNIAKLAEEECDRMTLSFIDWFIEEQTEEEQRVHDIIKRLEIFGEEKASLYLMDKELGLREK
jgi:ferritin